VSDVPLDVLVVGGGPAGLATALLAARAGLGVRVVEARPAPVDKACGEGLMPGAVAVLTDLLGGPPTGLPLRGIRYVDGAGRVAQARFRGEPGLGVRRTTLYAGLWDAVAAAGIEVATGKVTQVRQDADGVLARLAGPGARDLRARYLVAADGLHSPLRRALGLDAPTPSPQRWGLRRHVAAAPWTDSVEVHWGKRSEAYLTPVGPDLVGVALLTADRAPFDVQLARFPAVLDRLDGAAPASDVRGAGPLRRQARARTVGRVLLVGDAAGYVDALTGEGIAVALASARALVRCLAADRPQDYELAWRRATRRSRWLTSSLLWAGSRAVLRPTIVPAAAALPWAFGAAVRQLAR
jgi:flavin-dependent dehydrogenase